MQRTVVIGEGKGRIIRVQSAARRGCCGKERTFVSEGGVFLVRFASRQGRFKPGLRFFQPLGRAGLALADAFGEVGGQAFGQHPGLFLLHPVLTHGLIGHVRQARIGLFQAFVQPVSHAGYLAGQALQGFRLGDIGAGETGFDGLRHARHLGAQLFGDAFVAGLDLGDALIDALGDAQHLAAHAVDGLGRGLLGVVNLDRNLIDRVFQKIKPADPGGVLQPLQHVFAQGLDPVAEIAGQPLQLQVRVVKGGGGAVGGEGGAAFGLHQAPVQSAEGGAQVVKGRARAGLCGFQPFGDRSARIGGLETDQRAFNALEGVDAVGVVAFDPGQTGVGAPLFLAHDAERAFETRGQAFLALDRIDAADGGANRLVNVRDGDGGTGFGGLQAGGQIFNGGVDPGGL